MKFGTLGIIIGLLALLLIGGCNSYNGFVSAEEDVEKVWADVQSQYQRRADLIPNLVNTVKGAADFEKSTLESVVNARAKATSVNVDASNLSPEKLQQFQAAQGELSSSLGRLLVTVERYPELKANSNFRDLTAQLEGTENRIAVARDRFNEESTEYNKKIRRFPNSFFASVFGFDEKAQFQAQSGSETAPTVEF
ncbi:LemA family protein [Lewinellaceae bacterium SD302]|nr:LemA family protein [Lewinellaceae bacterium SD302]